MADLSDLDRRLLSALRADGREPVSVLAERLGVSRATVTRRMESLAAQGVIVGYTVRVRDGEEVDRVRAISCIAVAGRTTDQMIRELRGFPEIQSLHATNGRWDLIAEVSCSDLVSFDALLRRLRGTPGVVGSETSLLLSSVVR
ncbi:Lrp/AsnC family transcriptional regulator [Brachybacterium sp. AOP25-B2-12]|uniref:Lrp/AsnC family transcriptional regulator n=1 Tax=Brachybacterium sp. AOP25-B2-12 TaxID=3457710 RepID=UPI004034249E